MPLSDFVRYLNAQHPLPTSGLRSTTPFVSEDGQVFVHFANLRLESSFSPIVDTAGGRPRGHVAHLNAIGLRNRQPVDSDGVFALASDDEDFIYLDRLVRTLHALNYLTYLNSYSRGTLLLQVHPRHVAGVAADHGLAFEEVLHACGLLPKQITLEIEIDAVDDAVHLVRAIANYKSRGYGIAVRNFGLRDLDFTLLSSIRPAIVRLDPGLLSFAEPIRSLIDHLHEHGAQVMIEGLNTETRRNDAAENGFDLLQVQVPPGALLQTPATALSPVPERHGLTVEAA